LAGLGSRKVGHLAREARKGLERFTGPDTRKVEGLAGVGTKELDTKELGG
jgi:hypothetical protein